MTSYIPFEILRTGFNINSIVTISENYKKLDKKLAYLKGERLKFIKILGNSASVKFKNSLTYVPLEAILNYEENTIITEPSLNDTLFIVKDKNKSFPVGTVFKATLIKSRFGLSFMLEDNTYQVNNEWLAALSAPIKKDTAIMTLDKKFNVKLEDVSQNSSKVKDSISEDIAKLSPVFVKPTVQNISNNFEQKTIKCREFISDFVSEDVSKFKVLSQDIEELLSEQQGEYIDISGIKHTSLLACLKANQLFIDTAYLRAFVQVSKTDLGEI